MSELKKFIFKGLPVRGAIVRLSDAWQEVLFRQQQSENLNGNPALSFPPVKELLGEMSAASVLLHTNIKFDGTLILQIQGSGPLKLAVAEAQADMGIRATATVTGQIQATDTIETLSNQQGQGRCAITLDPKNRQPGQHPYQGIVPLSDLQGKPFSSLADVIEGYMCQSEQLPSCIILAADDRCAAGLLIQRLPGEGEKNIGTSEQPESVDEAFERIAVLAKTLKSEELLTLDTQTILHRLFWQEEIQLFDDVQQPYFKCTCSRERVANMIIGLGENEAQSIIQEKGKIDITCDFCGALYQFDAIDTHALFVPDHQSPASSQALQ